jgi:hypothetical protein
MRGRRIILLRSSWMCLMSIDDRCYARAFRYVLASSFQKSAMYAIEIYQVDLEA